MTEDQKPFRVEKTIGAPADTVWRALTEPDVVRNWFGWDYEGLPAEIESVFVDGADPQPPDLIVLGGHQEIGLVGGAGRTMVRVVTTQPLPAGTDPDRYDAVEEGWRVFFEQLRFLLERHPGERRSTLYLTGRASGRQLLGVLAEEAAKEVWHESRFAHLVVGAEGHLLAATAEQPLPDGGPGPVSLTVSAYGLDDQARAALRERWTARWRKAVTDAEVTP
ncbi:SRPBCC domain-containing protein [Streptomyces sp. A3M-1-3]|uniref:SRPBCC family protein n=1 Tax=Streptomyces sp. A3M-1-3 TaxID=2962044 RepID=UPI0020B7897C|nr:SRPBCC domain-containing protein [Streptomyces sp. A3M-1-3]MCP3822251.1 SRPBCC domain-containing protein [Streptomyces sp. A3M-1-3]